MSDPNGIQNYALLCLQPKVTGRCPARYRLLSMIGCARIQRLSMV
jgi:hypothetical protein